MIPPLRGTWRGGYDIDTLHGSFVAVEGASTTKIDVPLPRPLSREKTEDWTTSPLLKTVNSLPPTHNSQPRIVNRRLLTHNLLVLTHNSLPQIDNLLERTHNLLQPIDDLLEPTHNFLQQIVDFQERSSLCCTSFNIS